MDGRPFPRPCGLVITITGSKKVDPSLLAPLLRADDKAEVWAAQGNSPQAALEQGLKTSILCYTAWLDEKPLAMFGVTPDQALMEEAGINYGTIWFLGSDEATQDPKAFMRLSRTWLNKLKQHFDFLGNVVDERNKTHVRWIRAMGFEFVKIHPRYGIENRPFLEFFQRC